MEILSCKPFPTHIPVLQKILAFLLQIWNTRRTISRPSTLLVGWDYHTGPVLDGVGQTPDRHCANTGPVCAIRARVVAYNIGSLESRIRALPGRYHLAEIPSRESPMDIVVSKFHCFNPGRTIVDLPRDRINPQPSFLRYRFTSLVFARFR